MENGIFHSSLIVVEHDEDTIRNADYIVDIGPKAGVNGGNIIAYGAGVNDIIKNDDYNKYNDYVKASKNEMKVLDSLRKSGKLNFD